jgi:hypothetical protein
MSSAGLTHTRGPELIAAAPLFSPGAFPAVMVPFSRKAGFNLAKLSSVVSERLCSSCWKAVGPLRDDRGTGVISASKSPWAWARANRCCDRNAQRSCASREISYFSTKSSGTQEDFVGRRHDGLSARAADAVYRHRWNRHREARIDCGLAARVHLAPGWHVLQAAAKCADGRASGGSKDHGSRRHGGTTLD